MNTEKGRKDQRDQELDLDALDRVSGGTKIDHVSAIKDAIKKAMDATAEIHNGR